MLRLQFSIALGYEIDPPHSDFIFALHAARTAHQTVVTESLDISQDMVPIICTDPFTHTRQLRLRAEPGLLTVRYAATVDIDHHTAARAAIAETAVAAIPVHVLPYIYPSRYCQSDRLHGLAQRDFGELAPGYERVRAVRDWVNQHVKFQPATSNASTSAVDTLVDRAGVCRDFAHLMIALCRALNVPARFVSGIDYGADPALGPMDFHAYVEAWLDGRWYIFDPSGVAIPMGFLRLGTGRDAADTAFATLFGSVRSGAPEVTIEAVPNAQKKRIEPHHVAHALSTDGEAVVASVARSASGGNRSRRAATSAHLELVR